MILIYKRFADLLKYKGLVAILCFFSSNGFAQCLTYEQVKHKLQATEKDTSLSLAQKNKEVLYLKEQFDHCGLIRDSVYALILNRLGVYDYKLNNGVATIAAINYTLEAIKVNRLSKGGNSLNIAISSYRNLGILYRGLLLFNKTLEYFDSTILVAGNTSRKYEVIRLRIDKMLIYFRRKDYQKIIDEGTIGIFEARQFEDSFLVMSFLSARAEAYYFIGQYKNALSDADKTLAYATSLDDHREMANALKIKALISAAERNYSKAGSFFREAIRLRIILDDNKQIADDYTDYGNFYLMDLKDYPKAIECYLKTIAYASKSNDAERLAKGQLNLGAVEFYKHNYEKALEHNYNALLEYKVPVNSSNYTINPPSASLGLLVNKELLLFIFNNKTEILLHLYKQTNNKAYLSASLQTALLMDSLITKVRFEQAGEISKLYWRNKTREFFTNAMEACYLAADTRLAYYFMEKSRAVLLNDKLNELEATSHLPAAEITKEQEFKIEVMKEQQKLTSLPDDTPEFETQQLYVLQARGKLERYLKSMETKYPVYYQYKYEDEVFPLKILQQYLVKNNRNFVHYFMNDTVIYMLGVSGDNSRMIRLSKNDFKPEQINKFLYYCADEHALLNDYSSFASLSNILYKKLFLPLQIPKGGIIICPDNFLIPFEALCVDTKGEQFLINDYAFSYVYSARYLLKNTKPSSAQGDFIGFAPISFQPYLNVPDLEQSAVSMQKAATYYSDIKLFTNNLATKNNFFRHVSRYTVAQVFSHALADTSDNEPLLFMQDSIVRLSDLQLIRNPATRLVLLSACQTNVGKSATGEGIYSLTRGFASTGIPSVVATLWEADEQSIYDITESFHKYLSQGLYKDDALQKAKLDFLHRNNERKLLPFYWANMVVMGNIEPVKLSGYSKLWMFLGGGLALGVVVILVIMRRRHSGAKA